MPRKEQKPYEKLCDMRAENNSLTISNAFVTSFIP